MRLKKGVIFIYVIVFLSIIFSFALVSARAIPPKVYSTSTINPKFTNGEFFVNYNSAEIDRVILYYGTDPKAMNQIAKTDCECGRNKQCSFKPDLTRFENKQITYFFVVIDKKGNIGQSVLKNVKVDIIAPEIMNSNSMISSINKNMVTFEIHVHDNNFDRIEYIDNFDSGKSIVLCKTMNSDGMCKVKKRFDKGDYNFAITAFDKAGNSIKKALSFSVM